jgi:hypothetical protein
MSIINENDAKNLDKILVFALQNGVATNKNLPALNNEFLSNQPEIKNMNYSYYIEIIDENKIAHVSRFKGGFEVKPIPVKTQRFIENGGFLREYQNIQEEREQNLTREMQESEIRKLTVKELKGNIFQLRFWWIILLINAIVSLLIALITKG